MNLDWALGQVRDAEETVEVRLRALGERHAGDAEVVELSATLARFAHANLAALAPYAERYGIADPRPATPEQPGRPDSPGLLLLQDLRALHLAYAAAAIDWTVLGQGAQAVRDQELAATAARCRARTERGLKWTTTQLKTAAPQTLAS